MKRALEFEVNGRCGKARSGKIYLPHGEVETPVFMPVGTQGTIKGLTSSQVSDDLKCEIILGNTYHLSQRPGTEVLSKAGGLHDFMNFHRCLLTDSGGFQMVSLLKLCDIDEKGVKFQSPHDGSILMLTPEESMRIQNIIGADIMMALDDVVHSLTEDENRVKDAMKRTLRWIDRCISAHERKADQNLFGIIQGGLDETLRGICCREMMKRDENLPGYAIGGLSGGEDKNKYWKVVNCCTDILPFMKPRYCMGVGYVVDIIVSVALGVDMFDCVYPCRTARFGTGLTHNGVVKLRSNPYKWDFSAVSSIDSCPLINDRYSKSYFQRMKMTPSVSSSVLTYHNIAFMMELMKEMRNEIKKGTFNEWVKKYLKNYFKDEKDYPKWVKDSLSSVGIFLSK